MVEFVEVLLHFECPGDFILLLLPLREYDFLFLFLHEFPDFVFLDDNDFLDGFTIVLLNDFVFVRRLNSENALDARVSVVCRLHFILFLLRQQGTVVYVFDLQIQGLQFLLYLLLYVHKLHPVTLPVVLEVTLLPQLTPIYA